MHVSRGQCLFPSFRSLAIMSFSGFRKTVHKKGDRARFAALSSRSGRNERQENEVSFGIIVGTMSSLSKQAIAKQ